MTDHGPRSRPKCSLKHLAGTAVLAVVVMAGLSGCSGPSNKLAEETPTTTPATFPTGSVSTTTTGLVNLSLFFVRDGSVAPAVRTFPKKAARLSALKALFTGPSVTEAAAGLSSEIPAAADVESVALVNGVGYVNVNAKFFVNTSAAAFRLAVAQIVYTITASSSATGVQILLHSHIIEASNGIDLARPLTRTDLQSEAGPVLIESPAVGDTLSGPLEVSGTSSTDGTLEIDLVGPNGTLVAPTNVQTIADGGSFDVTIPFTQAANGTDSVRVYVAPASGGPTQLIEALVLRYQSSSA
jgi:germination protein M